MDAKDTFETYFRFISGSEPMVFAVYARNARETPRATTALAHVGIAAFPSVSSATGPLR